MGDTSEREKKEFPDEVLHAKPTKQLAEYNLNKNGGTNGERKYT